MGIQRRTSDSRCEKEKENMRKAPCIKECESRQPGCHATCQKYLEWKAERELLLEQIHKENAAWIQDTKETKRQRYYYRMKYKKR